MAGRYFKTLTPSDNNFEFDRCGPVDHFYIINFLEAESSTIKGNVLEIADNALLLNMVGIKLAKAISCTRMREQRELPKTVLFYTSLPLPWH